MSEAPNKPRRSYEPDPHRLLPQDVEAEKGLLSSFLIAPTEIGGFCVEKDVNSQWFSMPAHAVIYRNLVEMWDKNEPIDFITLTNWMRNQGELDFVPGGAAYVTELFTFLPTAANAPHYVGILQEKLQLREVIRVGTEYAARGYDDHANIPQLIDQFEAAALRIRQTKAANTMQSAKTAVVHAIAQIEETYSRKGSIGGIATGFMDLDRLTDGLHGSELIVIAARPSQGKTALAMNIAEFIAVNLKKPVGVFSLEMSTNQLFQRMLCSRARVNLFRVRDGFLSERDFPDIQMAASKISEAKLYVDDQSGMTIQQLRAKARKMKQQYGIEALFVDYLQLLKSTSRQAESNRQLEVSEVSAGLKDLSKELNIPLVVLAQINRKFDERAMNGQPRLSDLRESGSIEQDADTVGFLVRHEMFADNEEDREKLKGKAMLIIAKQRHGPTGDVPLTFIKEYTRFETRARSDEEEPEHRTDGGFPV